MFLPVSAEIIVPFCLHLNHSARFLFAFDRTEILPSVLINACRRAFRRLFLARSISERSAGMFEFRGGSMRMRRLSSICAPPCSSEIQSVCAVLCAAKFKFSSVECAPSLVSRGARLLVVGCVLLISSVGLFICQLVLKDICWRVL